jgi:hypothetical protein
VYTPPYKKISARFATPSGRKRTPLCEKKGTANIKTTAPLLFMLLQ